MNWESWRIYEIKQLRIFLNAPNIDYFHYNNLSKRFKHHLLRYPNNNNINYINWKNEEIIWHNYINLFMDIPLVINKHWSLERIIELKQLIESKTGNYFTILSQCKIFSYRFAIYLKRKRDKEGFYGKR